MFKKGKSEENDRLREDFEQFTYVIAHDLREALRNISWATSVVNESKACPEMKRIVAATQQMDNQLDGILLFCQLTVADLSPDDFSCYEVASEAIKSLGPLIERTGASVTIDAPHHAFGDPGMILQCLVHLITNGINFHDAEHTPHVCVTSAIDSGIVTLSVADRGPGIDKKYYSRVFLPFKLIKEGSGVGIGLAIVNRIAARHGSQARVTSNPDGGSTFSFGIPHKDPDNDGR